MYIRTTEKEQMAEEKRRSGNWRMQKKRRKMENQNIWREMRKGGCNNTKYLLQPCPSDCCSFSEVICIRREVIVPLIPCGIFYLILKVRSSPGLLRKRGGRDKNVLNKILALNFSLNKDEIVTTGFKDYRNLPHRSAHILSMFRALPSLQAPYLTPESEQKGLLPKTWVSVINCKSSALHSTRPHGVNFPLPPSSSFKLGEKKSITFDNLHFFSALRHNKMFLIIRWRRIFK